MLKIQIKMSKATPNFPLGANRNQKRYTLDNKESKSKSFIGEKGEFVRKDSVFRNIIKSDGSSEFTPEKGRYHLYVSLACPWASRCLIVRKLKGLDEIIPYTAVDWILDERGWKFTDKLPMCNLDTVNNCEFVSELYRKADPEYNGRFTVPILWDKKTGTIVNNESAEILRMFNSELNQFSLSKEQQDLDLYPEELRSQIDELNAWIYQTVNNGVYKSGFAVSQEAYNEAVVPLFDSLEKLEVILGITRFLTGSKLTEADIRLFTTLIRFDMVYHGHFKCNKKRIVDYPNLWAYTRDIYQIPGVAETVNFEHIVNHYHMSHTSINPYSIVPIGPVLDLNSPPGRENM